MALFFFQRPSSKSFNYCISDTVFGQLISLLPSDTDEFHFLCKLSEALLFHGHKSVGISLAYTCAQKIVSTYPDKCETSELNCISMTEKACTLCSMIHQPIGIEIEKLIFDLAIIGLTVPRLPAATTKDEVILVVLTLYFSRKISEN